MSYEHTDGFGALFKNKKKAEGTKQPDYKGSLMVGGKVWEIAGWVKQGGSGSYLSLKGQEPREQEAAPKREAHPVPPDDDEKIPF